MEDLKQKTYQCLSKGLTEIFGAAGSLIAQSEIQGLNIGLCLLQCGLFKHPLVQSMILGNKRYFAYWSNDAVMERMLQAWLQSEMLLTLDKKDFQKYETVYLKAVQAAAHYLEPLRMTSQGEEPRIYPYTFLMVGHLARNLSMLKPEDPQAKAYFLFTLQYIHHIAHNILQNKSLVLLDFCISYFAGIADYLDEDSQLLIKRVVDFLHEELSKETFWKDADDTKVAHFLMDLHIGGVLPDRYLEKSILELINRIDAVLDQEQVDMQLLTRLTRSLGELAQEWPDIPDMLQRQITEVYSENILDEVHRVVLDREGMFHHDITQAVEEHRRGLEPYDSQLLQNIMVLPWSYEGFTIKTTLEYIDIVKPPYQTLKHGGDCDCTAAMYAALLLAAGHKRVHLFHLGREDMQQGRNVPSYHAVACLVKDILSYNEQEFFCFDAQAQEKRGEPIPQLIMIGKNHVELINSKGSRQSWQIIGVTVLDARNYMKKGRLKSKMERFMIEPTRGLHMPSSSDTEPLYLPWGMPTWVLMHLDDNDGVGNRIREYMFQKVDLRRNSFADIITYYSESVFDRYREAFGLDRKKVDYPALVLYYYNRCEGGQKPEPPLLLDYKTLQLLESELGFAKMVVELQKYSQSRQLDELNKLVKSLGRKQKVKALTNTVIEFSSKYFAGLTP